MRDADTPPQDPADDRSHPAALTPQQRADLIRAAAAEVRDRVQEWRHSPGWQETLTNLHRYYVTVAAVAAVDGLPESETGELLVDLVETLRPVLAEWRPSRPGAEQQIHAAVERLRRACS